MTMWNNKAFTENELSFFSKIAVIILVVSPVIWITANNIIFGKVEHPYAFAMCILGFILFLISKISSFRKGIVISFGGRYLSENMLNCYRLGYWFMAVGVILTFVN